MTASQRLISAETTALLEEANAERAGFYSTPEYTCPQCGILVPDTAYDSDMHMIGHDLDAEFEDRSSKSKQELDDYADYLDGFSSGYAAGYY